MLSFSAPLCCDVWQNWHHVWLGVPSICSGSQGRERWLHHTASPQQLPDLPCCIRVWRWGFPVCWLLFFFPSLSPLDVLYYTLWQCAAAVGVSVFLLPAELLPSLQAAAGWMLWSWRSAAPVSTSWQPKPGERQTSARLPSLPIFSTCCRPAHSVTWIFCSKQPTQPRVSQAFVSIANPFFFLIVDYVQNSRDLSRTRASSHTFRPQEHRFGPLHRRLTSFQDFVWLS